MTSKEDNLVIGNVVLTNLGLPIVQNVLDRSTITDDEIRVKIASLLRNDVVDTEERCLEKIKIAIQAILLKAYLTELYVDGIIKKPEIESYLRKWAE